MDISLQITKFNIFKNVDKNEINNVIKGSSIKKFKSNTIVLNEGDSVNNVYFISEGQLQVYLSNNEGKEIIIKDLLAGDSFGELGVLCNSKRCANIITKTDVLVVAIDGATFKSFYQNNIYAANYVINLLAKSLSKLTKDYESLALDNLKNRLIRVLLEISIRKDNKLIVEETHENIANRIAVSRETVSRAIGRMKENGLIKTKNNYFILTNELLELYAQL